MGLVFLGLEVGAGALAYTSYNEYLKNQDDYIIFNPNMLHLLTLMRSPA